jgi:ribosome-associated protein
MNPRRAVKQGDGIAMQITTPYIKLDSLLKAENAVSSGGEAKAMIAEGYISVNGEVEYRRGRKLYPGDRVVYGKRTFLVESA